MFEDEPSIGRISVSFRFILHFGGSEVMQYPFGGEGFEKSVDKYVPCGDTFSNGECPPIILVQHGNNRTLTLKEGQCYIQPGSARNHA